MSQTPEPVPVTSLPYAERRNRLIFDTLRFNAEAAQAAFLRVSQLLETIYGRRPTAVGPDVNDAELSVMFSDAWTVVRSCRSIFEIMRKEKITPVQFVENDIKLSESVAKSRNRMDHIADNIGNYAKKTSETMPPILGVITACFVPKCEIGSPVEEIHAIALSHSDFHHAINLKIFPQDEKLFPLSGWIDHIRLHAFDFIVELSEAADFLRRLLLELNAVCYESKRQRLNVIVLMRGQTPFEANWGQGV